MAQTPEGKVKAKVVGILKSEGVYYFFPATHGFGRSGVPDIVACVSGNFVGIECKAGKNKPTALQVREIEGIRSAGGVAVVVNEENWDSVRPLVRALRGLS
jgi:Holliday junction resolvase